MAEQNKVDQDAIAALAYKLWQEEGEPEGRSEHFWHKASRQLGEGEREYDQAVEDSFPASDPPASSGITTAETGKPDAKPDAAPAAVKPKR